MIEIPESKELSKQLNETISGKLITKVITNASPHKFAFFHKDPEDYEELLCGKRIGTAKPIGGQIEVEVEDTRLLFGEGLNIRYFEADAKIPQKHQLYIQFEDNTSLTCTAMMYGLMFAYPNGEMEENIYYAIAKRCPNPLSDEFDMNYFKEMVDGVKPSLSVKALLATEQRIPGLGNGALQDILFEAKLNPKRKVQSLSEEDIDSLYHSVKEVLLKMTKLGGRDTEKNIFGLEGGYKTKLSKKTVKLPCPVCGSQIVRQAFLGGNVYFCPCCQPL